MKILTRYLLVSIVKPLLFCLVGFFFLWIVYDLFGTLGEIMNSKLGFFAILVFYLVQLPKVAPLVLPVAFLFAMLFVLARASRQGELVVWQASGLSLARLSVPFLIISGCLSLVLFFLNLEWAPKSEERRERLRQEFRGRQIDDLVFHGVIFQNPRHGTVWYISELNVTQGVATHPRIIVKENFIETDYLVAATATYRDGLWELVNVGRIRYDPDGNFSSFEHLDQLNAHFLTESPEQLIAAERPPDQLSLEELAQLIHRDIPLMNERRLAPFQTEYLYRFASPLIVPILCCFGIALGVGHGRRSVAASVFGSVFFLFAMLVWNVVSMALGNVSRLPPWFAAWSGTLFFATLGIALLGHRTGWWWILGAWLKEKLPALLPKSPRA